MTAPRWVKGERITDTKLNAIADAIDAAATGGSAGVTSLNSLAGALTLAAGTNVSLGASGSTITISASGGGAGMNGVGTIAALKAASVSGVVSGDPIMVRGYYADADGGGGLFLWNAVSTATDNGGTIIQVTGVSTGRWIRFVPNGSPLNVEWFGAKGDGTTNDRAAIVAAQAVLTAAGGGALYFPAGTYIVGSAITLTGVNNCVWYGDGLGTSVLKASGTADVLVLNGCGFWHLHHLGFSRAAGQASGRGIVLGVNGSTPTANIRIEWCFVNLHPGGGIVAAGTVGAQLSECGLYHNAILDNGSASVSQVTLTYFNDFTMDDNAFGMTGLTPSYYPKAGVEFVTSGYGSYTNNRHWLNRNGAIFGGTALTITGNRFEMSRFEGVVFNTADRCIFSNNKVHTNSQAATGTYDAVTCIAFTNGGGHGNVILSWDSATYKHRHGFSFDAASINLDFYEREQSIDPAHLTGVPMSFATGYSQLATRTGVDLFNPKFAGFGTFDGTDRPLRIAGGSGFDPYIDVSTGSATTIGFRTQLKMGFALWTQDANTVMAQLAPTASATAAFQLAPGVGGATLSVIGTGASPATNAAVNITPLGSGPINLNGPVAVSGATTGTSFTLSSFLTSNGGYLSVNGISGSTNAPVYLSAFTGGTASIEFQRGGTRRWQLATDSSDVLNLASSDASGANSQTLVSANRSTATMALGNAGWTLSLLGTLSGNGSGLTALNASNLGTGTVPTARLGSGTASSTTFLRGDGTWATPGGGAYTFTNNNRILGNIAGTSQAGQELTGTQTTALLDTFTSGLKGLAPASGGGTTNFLRADGTWATPAGGGGGIGVTTSTRRTGVATRGMMPLASSNANITLTQSLGWIYCWPIYWPWSEPFDRFRYCCANTYSGGTSSLDVAIFDLAGTSRLAYWSITTPFSTTALQVSSVLGSPVTLTAGWYLLAVLFNASGGTGAPSLSAINALVTPGGFFGVSPTTLDRLYFGGYNTAGFSSIGTSLPSFTTGLASNAVPIIALDNA